MWGATRRRRWGLPRGAFLGLDVCFTLDWLRAMHSLPRMVAIRHNVALCALPLLFAACHSAPPSPWLRYELDGQTQLASLGGGRFGGDVHGASVTVSLYDERARIHVVVENRTADSLSVAVGPDAGVPEGAVGEVLLRQLDGPAAGGPDMVGYDAMAPVALDGGWRATFFLDQPLGRDIKLGQYFVFAVEVSDTEGQKQRVQLPVVGKMGGVARREKR